MPLILVVDPNRQQAARVAAVLRRRARTEVVIAESATGALDAVAARVPDVLLTSALLSEREESVLADWLRGPLDGYMRDVLLTDRCLGRGWWRPEALWGVINEHASGLDYSKLLYSALAMEGWGRLFLL